MNLKESFRYQSFLDSMMTNGKAYISNADHCLTTKEIHHKSTRNPDAADEEKIVEKEVPFHVNDVIEFMEWLIGQKMFLTEAIGKAKAGLPQNMDALVESNKHRQTLASAMKYMLNYKSRKATTQQQDYKFNNEGNQMAYLYEVETVFEEKFNRDQIKKRIRELMESADEISTEIDSILINTKVDVYPMLDVNSDFEDCVRMFLSYRDRLIDN